MRFSKHSKGYQFGPSVRDGMTCFRAWAPAKKEVALSLDGKKYSMERVDEEFWEITLGGMKTGSLYGFILDGEGPFPDPGGRFMPKGIYGLSQVVQPEDFHLSDEEGWKGIDISSMAIYEVHTGTFSGSGKYSGIGEKIDHFVNLGINTVEIMPVSQFFGKRNWGYDGVYIYSPAASYGTPQELAELVRNMHRKGIAVLLDVVYNHSGLIGNFLDNFGPFHSEWHRTPWGNCFNLDGPFSDSVRSYILENVLFWIREYGFDGLRLDAVHGIVDTSPVHILEEIGELSGYLSESLGRKVVMIAESDKNDAFLTSSVASCGYGINGQWSDDFHHSLHTLFTGENRSYYADYGTIEDLRKTIKNGFLFNGQYSSFLKKSRGTEFGNAHRSRLVVCSQNHDQIGNRAFGERLITLAGLVRAMQASALTILSPFTPMIFQGEEMAIRSPFLFFVDAPDEETARSIARGRRGEFSDFQWTQKIPDPNDTASFTESVIDWKLAGSEEAMEFMSLYRKLFDLRKKYVSGDPDDYWVSDSVNPLVFSYRSGMKVAFNAGKEDVSVDHVPEEILLDIPTDAHDRKGDSTIIDGMMKPGLVVYL